MLSSTNAQNRVPTVGRSAQIARRQIDERLAYAVNIRRRCGPTDRHHRRQSLRRPEDRLFVEGPLRIMSESRGPISS